MPGMTSPINLDQIAGLPWLTVYELVVPLNQCYWSGVPLHTLSVASSFFTYIRLCLPAFLVDFQLTRPI